MGFLGYVFAGAVSWGSFAEKAAVAAAVSALSILGHELGHASAGLAFGCRPRITLLATGGSTSLGKVRLSFWRELIVTASGPAAGLLLCALAAGALRLDAVAGGGPLVFFAFAVAKGVNLVWSELNLLPALPLDGGNILRIVLQRFLGPRGLRYAHRWSVLGCGLLAAYGLWTQDWLLAFFAYSMAASNFKTARLLNLIGDEELRPENQRVIEQVVALAKEGRAREAYELMLALEPILGPRNICALARQACELGFYRKAVDLAEALHKKRGKDYSVAFLAARGHAGLGDASAAARWLKKAISEGLSDASEKVEACRDFDAIRADAAVREALSPLNFR